MVAQADLLGWPVVGDRAEICNLLARYALAVDQRDSEAVAACFTEDGAASFAGAAPLVGRDALVAYLQPLADVPLTQHVVGLPVVSVAGDIASATSYTTVHAVRPVEGGGHVVHHRGLRYDDRLVRTAHGWRFAERVHSVLWTTVAPTVWPPT